MKKFAALAMCAAVLAACAANGASSPAPGTQAAVEEQTRNMSATPGLLMVRLGVADLERSANFYSEVFGMTSSPYGAHERSMAHPNGGAGILLYQAAADAPASSASSTNGMIMRVADADEVVRRAVAAGGQVRGQVRDIPQMNMRVVGVIDPDGTFIEVVQAGAR